MKGLPKTVDPKRYASTGRELSGLFLLSQLKRLADVVVLADESQIEAHLTFSMDRSQRVMIQLKLKGRVYLTCQRCLHNVEYSIDKQLLFSPVEDESMAQYLPDDYEPVLLDQGVLSPLDLIEDELLLSMPVIAMHDDCTKVEGTAYRKHELEESQEALEGEKTRKPFLELAEVLKTLND